MNGGVVVSLLEARERRRRRQVQEAYEAEQERRRVEASDRLHRLLDAADWPPHGGSAA